MKRNARRFGIVIIYLSLAGIALNFELFIKTSTDNLYLAFEICLFMLFAITFYFSMVKTGFWQLAHRHPQKLDEREISVTNNALRSSYAIFTILILLYLLASHLLEYSIGMPSIAALILLAHLLPSSALAWKEVDQY